MQEAEGNVDIQINPWGKSVNTTLFSYVISLNAMYLASYHVMGRK